MIRNHVNSLMDLFFPDCCQACDQPLMRGEELICVKCRYEVPYTDFHLMDCHEGVKLLGGQFPLASVLAYMYFDTESRVQRMIHRIKYFNKPVLAYRLGVEYGEILTACGHPCLEADAIVPVPMSPERRRKRGYNQSEVFASGLSSVMGLPVWSGALRRKPGSPTQVGKGRQERFRNISTAILPGDRSALSGAHVLLADDVLTSGATVIACADMLMEASIDRISVVTIARKR